MRYKIIVPQFNVLRNENIKKSIVSSLLLYSMAGMIRRAKKIRIKPKHIINITKLRAIKLFIPSKFNDFLLLISSNLFSIISSMFDILTKGYKVLAIDLRLI